MYWQPIVLWCLGILVAPSLQQQCIYHRTPFTTTCAIQVSPPTADQSSVLFPQTSDLDYVVMSDSNPKDTAFGYTSEQQQQQQLHQIAQPSQDHHVVVYDSSPPSSLLPPTVNSASATSASSSPASTAMPKRRVTIPSFEEWKKRIRQNEESDANNRKPKRKPNRGTTNQGRETIDSVDGGFSDDVGSVFETGDPNGPVSTAENTYEEGEYIAPQKQQQQQQSNKKHFAQMAPLKSLKERFNYAWTICAATVRDANKEARGAQSILFESKDQYLLNKCSADKFVIINLCEEILIDTIVLANFEFFSSTFKDFRVYVANTYPTKEWQLLGQWQARNTRDLQVFKVQDSIHWFEYIKIEFLTHYGNEYYCPLSLVRVHGMPMMEYYNAVESQGLSGDDGETEGINSQHLWPADVRDDIIHPQLVTNTSEWFPSKGDTDLDNDDTTVNDHDGQQPNTGGNGETATVILPKEEVEEGKQQHLETTDTIVNHDQQHQHLADDSGHQSSPSSTSTVEPPLDEKILAENTSSEPILPTTTTTATLPEKQADKDDATTDSGTTQSDDDMVPTISPINNINDGTMANEMDASNKTSHDVDFATLRTGNSNITIDTTSSIDWQPSSALMTNDSSDFTGNVPLTTESHTWSSEHDSAAIRSDMPSPTTTASVSAGATFTTKTHEAHINVDDTRHKNAHSKEPSTQESIYKIIMKRLNALEVNATLSQRYLDEQNNMLNDVFGEMEKRHQDQLIFVLDRLNETASNRIDGMKRRYEQSYEDLKHQMESDMREMTAKISILTDQISFEKRVSMVQLAIVVTLFVFLALSRGTMSTLSPVMIAQAEERKRRQSDATATRNTTAAGPTNQRREPSSSTIASMTKSKLDRSKLSLSSSNKIKLDMDGRKAASLDALKLHLAQQADLLPKLPSHLSSSSSQSQSLQKPQPTMETSTPLSSTTSELVNKSSSHSIDTQPQQEKRNWRSISLNDITNDNGLENSTTATTSTLNEKLGNPVSVSENDTSNIDGLNTFGENHHAWSVGQDKNSNKHNAEGSRTSTQNKRLSDDDDLTNDSIRETNRSSKAANLNISLSSSTEASLLEEEISASNNDDDLHSGTANLKQQ